MADRRCARCCTPDPSLAVAGSMVVRMLAGALVRDPLCREPMAIIRGSLVTGSCAIIPEKSRCRDERVSHCLHLAGREAVERVADVSLCARCARRVLLQQI